jgi:GAF domain-containing protein/HAMP domain-containing protein
MNPNRTQTEPFSYRLLKRMGGKYLILATLATQVLTNLLIVPLAAVIQSNANLNADQFSASVWMTLLLVSISNAVLLLSVFLMSRNAYRRLEQYRRQQTLSRNTTEEHNAWREITALPWRYSLAAILTSFLIVMAPLIAYQYFALQLNTDQIGYAVLGGTVSAFAIVAAGAIGIERLLLPAGEILLPTSFEAQIKNIGGLRIRAKLLALTLALIVIGISVIGPIGYHEIVEITKGKELDIALLEFQGQSLLASALVLAFAAGLTFMAAKAFSDPYRQLVTVFQKVEQGDLKQRARVVASDEAGELEIHFNQMVSRLEVLQNSLEQLVAERTAQLAAVNEVGRAISAILDPDELIEKVVNLITNRFGHYYSAIFLLEPTGKWAELKSATGEAGRVLREARHRLAVDSKSMVGTAVSQKQARIALDVGAEPVRFNNPLLPYTRSEIALPLMVGERVLGVLDVQSTREAAFGHEDIETFQNMANQVAVALENAHLFQETNQRVQELQTAQRQYLREAWTSLAASEHLEYGVGDETLSTTETALSVPLTLRDEVIGQIDLSGDREWSPEERTWVESVATQAAIALENARLMEDSRKQAGIERTVAEITSRVWSANTIDGILQTAAKEIGRALNVSEATIELNVEEQGASDHG